MTAIAIGVVVFGALILSMMAIKIVPEYEHGVISRLGQLLGAKRPGFFLIFATCKH